MACHRTDLCVDEHGGLFVCWTFSFLVRKINQAEGRHSPRAHFNLMTPFNTLFPGNTKVLMLRVNMGQEAKLSQMVNRFFFPNIAFTISSNKSCEAA